MRATRRSLSVTREAMLFCEVVPRKPLASATPPKASRATAVLRRIRMPDLFPVGSGPMRGTVAPLCVVSFVIGVVILVAAPDIARHPRGWNAIPYLGVALAWGYVAVGSLAW